MAVSRRSVLSTAGLVGGVTALQSALAPMVAADSPDFTPLSGSRGRGKKVVVIGGGIAGLTTAYELLKGGYEVTILEGHDRPGGRNWTVRGGDTSTDITGARQTARFSKGQYMNCGPGRIPQHHVTIDYCRELGVELEPFVNANAEAFLWRPGTPLDGVLVKHRAAKADSLGYVAELLAKATDAGALDAELRPEEKTALLGLLTSMGGIGPRVPGDPAASFRYTGGSRRGFPLNDAPADGLNAGTPVDPWSLDEVLLSGIGSYFSFEAGWDQAMMMFQPKGGMDRIAYALADAVGRGRIQYESEVTSLKNTSQGVEVDYRRKGARRRALADFAVCTMQPHLAARLDTNLPRDVIAALGSVRVTNAGKIGIEYERRWWEEDHQMFGGITNSTTDVANMWFPSTGYLGRRGVVIGYYNTGARADRYGVLRPGARTAKALAEGSEIFGPVYGKDVHSAFSVNWKTERYIEGAWVGWPDGQGPGTPYAKLLEPSGNVYFASDALSHTIAWQHGAMTSARASVAAIHQRVTS